MNAMKNFFRENPTIAFGLGLPLLLVLVFLMISGIPTLLVAPPQYDILYATRYYNYNNGLQISVVNGKVRVVFNGVWQGYQEPRIWRYNAKTGAVKEITFTLPPGLVPLRAPSKINPEEAAKITPIDVPALATLTVDASSIAPDGYAFEQSGDRYANHFFTGLFYASRYRGTAVLTKNGRSIRLPKAESRNYSGRTTRFIGWVIPQ